MKCLFLLHLLGIVSTTTSTAISLVLDVPSPTLRLLPGTSLVTSAITGLETGKSYEMRINWPATRPGKFHIWIDGNAEITHASGALRSASGSSSGSDDGEGGKRTSSRRHLLNAHKEIFSVSFENENGKDGNDGKAEEKKYYGHVHVEKEGISWNVELENRSVPFNLIVEEVYLGVLPSSSFNLVVVLILVLFFGLVLVVPRLEKMLMIKEKKVVVEMKKCG